MLRTPVLCSERAAAVSARNGPIRMLEAGAGDGRLAHFLAAALNSPVAEASGSPGAGSAAAAVGSHEVAPESAHRSSAAELPALQEQPAAVQIQLSASDDGSLNLHDSSPFRCE